MLRPPRLAHIASALIALFLASGPSNAGNILTNPSFETLPSNLHLTSGVQILDGWRYFSVNGASFTLDATGDAHEGGIAMKLIRGSAAGDAGLDRDDATLRVPAISERTYAASIWAKAVGSVSVIVTLSPYDGAGQWLGVQANQTFVLTSTYQQYSLACATPANTASLNMAIRVNGTGTIVVDDCCLTETAPSITYPADETTDSLKPTIGFSGLAHTGYQILITRAGNTVWDSGTVASSAYSGKCSATLLPASSHQVKVRLMNTYGWGGYCAPVSFTTPAGPIVYFDTPKEADRVMGPDKLLTWQVESPAGPTNQSLVVDGGSAVQVPNGNRSYQVNGLTEGVHSAVLTVTTAEGTVQSSVRFFVYDRPLTSGTIYYYDLSYVLSYDQSTKLAYDIPMAVFALQGLVNRNGARLFIRMNTHDDRWWSILRASGGWLQGKTVVTLPSNYSNLANLFNTFRSDYDGAVLWDNNLNATSNVATTIAGADNQIPMRYDTSSQSVYRALVMTGPRLPIRLDLRNRFTGTGTIWGTSLPSTGSRKCDAYVWARTNYIETAKSDPSLLLYAIDAYWSTSSAKGSLSNYLPIRDYVVRNKGFAFDLNVWGDEQPIDDPTQTMGLDLSTMRSILGAAAARAPGMIEMIGFCPFPMKYSNFPGAGGTLHDPVGSEWEQIKWATLYNAYVDADALAYSSDMTNASLYCQYPMPDRLIQNRKLSPLEVRKLGYIDKSNAVSPLNYLNVYIGDYDSSSWLTRIGSDNWENASRGAVPMSWAFNPNLIKRAGPMYEYYNRTRTPNDFFVAGDCGAGYVNPSRLIGTRESGLPSAEDIWIKHNLEYFRKTNVKITGFLLNGTAGTIESDEEEMYAEFSVDGVFQRDYDDHMADTMPSLLQLHDLDMNADATTSIDIVHPHGRKWTTQFLNFRSVIRTPAWIQSLYNGVAAKDTTMPWACVDSATYAALAGCHLGEPPDCRATYTFDTLPSTVYAGVFITPTIGIRNDGWSDWAANGPNRVKLVLKWMQGTQTLSSVTTALPRDVASGDAVTIDITTIPPSAPGNYTLHYEMMRGGVAFTELGDYAWEKTVTAVPTGHFPPITGFSAVPSDSQISLSWTNPTDPDFAGVRILCKTTGYPTSVMDGTVIYDGAGTNCLHTGLANGTIYYYTGFAYDDVPEYSDPILASAMPQIFLDWVVEPFDSYAGGNLALQGAWLTLSDVSGQVESAVAKGGTGSAVLLDPVADGWSVGNYLSVTDKTTGYCYFSFDVCQDTAGASGAEAAYVSIYGSDSAVEIAKVHIQNGRLMVEYGSATYATLTTTAANLAWYNIKIGLNIGARQVDLWLDGASKGSGYAWKGNATRLSKIVVSSDRNAGLNPQKVYIDNLRLEPKPPTVAVVRDDGAFSPSLSKIHFSFDPVAGADGYQYCIGTTSNGAQVRGWTSIGTETDFTATGLSLSENTTYYIGAQCTNQFGTGGDRRNSNGIIVAPGITGILQAKALADAPQVYALRAKLVSAAFPGCFYVQEPDTYIGLKVISPAVVTQGDQVDIAGFMAGSGAERYMNCTGNGVIKTTPGPGGPYPVFLSHKPLGGGPLNLHSPGVTGGVGVNNIGLLVRTFGRFSYIDAQTFSLNDGSGFDLKCVVPSEMVLDPNWNYAQVTGISSCETVGSELRRMLLVRGQEGIAAF